MSTGDDLKESLRRTVVAAAANTMGQDVRFEFGTEYASNYVQFDEKAYGYVPMPAQYDPSNTHATKKDQVSRCSIFPRLAPNLEELKAKFKPSLGKLVPALKQLDLPGRGYLHQEQLEGVLREACDVFVSKADTDELLRRLPRNGAGQLDYNALVDLISGKEVAEYSTLSSGLIAGRPQLPASFDWPADSSLELSLRLRPAAPGFVVPGERMERYARRATAIRKEEGDAEKVHNLLRDFLLRDLITEPGRPGQPPLGSHFDLSFRNWLADQGVLSLTLTNATVSGPMPPEVYDVLDQIVYALGIPIVMPQLMVLTAQGASMTHGTVPQLTGRPGLGELDTDARSLTSTAKSLTACCTISRSK